MTESRFVYVTYIRTTPEKLWQALTDPEFTRRYWFESQHETEWQPGASWRLTVPGGYAVGSGEVVEVEPPQRLVLLWRADFDPKLQAEGHSRVTFELEPQGESVKLTVVHEIDRPDSKLVQTFSGGWPLLMASLKSLLETGEPLAATRSLPRGR
ncbi:MAG: SRPBCC family protein [Isosphaeraceae bacterium]|nr:SRPBCC family protein [Isosphaeraceae bacterium]